MGGRKGVAKGPWRKEGLSQGPPHMRMHVYVYLCAHGGGQGHVYEHTCNCVIDVCVLACLGSCLHVHMCARMALGVSTRMLGMWDVCFDACVCVPAGALGLSSSTPAVNTCPWLPAGGP